MPKSVHLSVDVAGVLATWSDRRIEELFQDPEGRKVSAYDVRVALQELLDGGVLFLPIGNPCEGWSDQTGCPGHQRGTDGN